MCLGKENIKSTSPVKYSEELLMDGVQFDHSIMMPINQISKPRLSRKITSTVKLNLNKYWTKFGELMTSPSSLKKVSSVRASKVSKNLFPQDIPSQDSKRNIRSLSGDNTDDNSGVFDQLKRPRFELLLDQCMEVEDNLENEIREICNNYECKCY